MAGVVATPQGTKWRVRRHFLLWRLRYRWDLLDGDDPIALLLSAAVALVLLPVELVLLLLLSAVPVLGRAVGIWGWKVSAVRDGDRGRLRWAVRGWGAAGRTAERVREELRTGLDPSLHADHVDQRRVGRGDGDGGTSDSGGWDGDSGGGDGGDGGGGD